MTKLLAALAFAVLCTAHVTAISSDAICKDVVKQLDPCGDLISGCCSFFDGCNVCNRDSASAEFTCTEKACPKRKDVECKKKCGASKPNPISPEDQEKQCAAHGEDCGKCLADKLCQMMTGGKCFSGRFQVADTAIYNYKNNAGDVKATCANRAARAKDDKICAAKGSCTECTSTKLLSKSSNFCVAFEGGSCAASSGMRQPLQKCPASDGCCDWFDGCNDCKRTDANDPLSCTKKACAEVESTKCNKQCKEKPVCPSADDICKGTASCKDGCPCPGCQKPPQDPCADKKCGDQCKTCTGDICPAVVEFCQAGGKCTTAKPTEEACQAKKPQGPCADKKCGEACSACKKGDICPSVMEYCQADGGECKATVEPTKEACSKPKCPAASDICSGKAKCAKGCPCPKCLAPTPAVEPALCCKAMTASCLACAAGQSPADYCKANPKTSGCKPNKCDAVRCAKGSKHACCVTKQRVTLTQGLLQKAERALAASSCGGGRGRPLNGSKPDAGVSADCKTLRQGLDQAKAALAVATSEAATAEAKQGDAVAKNGTTIGTNSSADATTPPNVAATQPATTAKVSAVELLTAAKNLADQQYKDAGCVEDPDKEGCAALKKAQALAEAALEAAKEDEDSPAAAVASAAAAVAAGVLAAALM